MSKLLRSIIIISVILVNIGCDQISKEVVRNSIDKYERIELIKSNFILTNVENTGAALSLGSDLPPALKVLFLQILPIIMLLILLRMIIVRTELSPWAVIGLAFAIGGGIGNIYDRVLYGSVTDFMHIDLGFVKTGIFNMADVSVVIGMILILVDFAFSQNRKPPTIADSEAGAV